MLKFIYSLILLYILINISFGDKIQIDSSIDCSSVDVINFKWDDSCLASNGGCDISQAKYWNFTGADQNPNDYSLNLDVSDQVEKVSLFINSTLSPCKFYLIGIQASTQLTVCNDFSVKENSVFTGSQLTVIGQNQFTFGSLFLVQTDVILLNQAILSSDQTSTELLSVDDLPPTLSIDVDSSIKLDANSTITTTYIHCEGVLGLYDYSNVEASNVVLENSFYIATTATLVSQTITFNNVSYAGTLMILGGIQVTKSLTLQDTNISIKNLVVPSLYIDETSILNIQSGYVEFTSLTLYGDLIVTDSAINFVSNKLATLNNACNITLQGLTNATFGNLVFSNNLQTVKNTAGLLNTTVNIVNSVYFQSVLDLKSNFIVTPNANLYITENLFLEDCINNEGSVQLSAQLVCYQKAFSNIGLGSELTLLGKAEIYAYEFYNNGTLSIINTATLHGNLLSDGIISIYEDQNFIVIGFCDLYINSFVLIQGITYNTTVAAFEVQNIVKLAGELSFNITQPPLQDNEYIYHLIRSQIYLESKFQTLTPDPSLAQYTLPIIYDKNSNGEVYELSINYLSSETSSQVEKSEEKKEKEKDKKIDIALGVILPLLFVFAVIIAFVIIYIRNRNRQYDLYQKIQESNNSL